MESDKYDWAEFVAGIKNDLITQALKTCSVLEFEEYLLNVKAPPFAARILGAEKYRWQLTRDLAIYSMQKRDAEREDATTDEFLKEVQEWTILISPLEEARPVMPLTPEQLKLQEHIKKELIKAKFAKSANLPNDDTIQ